MAHTQKAWLRSWSGWQLYFVPPSSLTQVEMAKHYFGFRFSYKLLLFSLCKIGEYLKEITPKKSLMKSKKIVLGLLLMIFLLFVGQRIFKKLNFNTKYEVGQSIDSLNNVVVYFNGGVGNLSGRNTTIDGYNLGMKYQCVEFVKRYYYEHLNHKMPDSYGNAKDFFDNEVADGLMNTKRDLTQYRNRSDSCPKVDDLLIFDGSISNKYGHVAIISKVSERQIEIIQQNPGPFGKSRINVPLENVGGKWELKNERILGWLRKEQ